MNDLMGQKIAAFEILSLLGEGGMGKVYRARDTKLKRDVAIKVLLSAVLSDRDRLARFEREAEMLASLNHPNIAAIYGVEDADGVKALVLELVEGPTLAERIARGPIPLDEALPIAKQIAEALATAHEHGIIHRDLKPANIKVRDDGAVKVLDFGLAKLTDPTAGFNPDLTSSLTRLRQGYGEAGESPAMTQAGVILGTAAYMSPEQARGRAVDKRTDIWAFGCVLYEMLSGCRPFEGDNLTDTLAAIVRAEPDWSKLPGATPPTVRTLLHRCLLKEPSRRLRDIGDARFDLDVIVPAPQSTAIPRNSSTRTWSISALAAVLGVVVGMALAWRMVRPAMSAPAPVISFDINTPASADPVGFALSPDGRQLVFVAESKLWLRRLDQTDAQPINGAEGAFYPFWSPDSRSVGFVAGGKLKRIEVTGGSASELANIPDLNFRGGTWNKDDVILFATNRNNDAIRRLSAAGGPVTDATEISDAIGAQVFPQFLPDGRRFIFTVTNGPQIVGVYVGTLDTTDVRPIKIKTDTAAIVTPPDRLLFASSGTLMMATLDPSSAAVVGESIPVVQPIGAIAQGTKGPFTASESGILAYRRSGTARRQLTWVQRNGQPIDQMTQVDDTGLFFVQLSPDDQRIAVQRTVDGNADLWLSDVSRAGFKRLTFGAKVESAPVWSHDGKRLTYRSNRNGAYDLFEKSVDSTEDEQVLFVSKENKTPNDWSPDGQVLLFERAVTGSVPDLLAWPRGTGAQPSLVAKGGSKAQFSPDGRWIAYQSDESGRTEIYVQPFPTTGSKSIVSVAGGAQPRWGLGGKEIYYVAADGWMTAVPLLDTGRQTFDVGPPAKLFNARLVSIAGPNQQYAVTRDGRFLLNRSADQALPITVVLNWMNGLKK